ncbi:hypothetical protein ILUMI_25473 [Ignelater luminosus]|uniref:Dehydrogenase/reductase SDR family protein 7-like n=1 Tax=Ignelater luminosus TaxID=2038154 RepID=A0A8K0CAH4_IGNLU|nr:hypothetical protein ILUMI_25473 [Ignelater luminosus]
MEQKKASWGFWLGSFAFALTIPLMAYRIIRKLCGKKSYDSFKGKVVVITGASSGIGEALAHEFYKQGCKVVLCARRQEELERVKLDLLQKHPTVPTYPPVVVPTDLSDINSLEGIVNQIIDITGHIDFLINNGGISNRGSVIDTNNDVFIRIMTVNYFGAVALTKAALPHMIKQKQGYIVFINSVQGLIAIPNRSAYAASKHALKAFGDTLRSEVARFNIHVTVINAGYVHTALSLNALTGSGNAHGQMDTATAQGYSTDYVAEKTALAVAQKDPEVILAPLIHKMAILMRTNLPRLYFYVMAWRAQRESKQHEM